MYIGPPHSSLTTAVILLGNHLPIPPQDRLWSDKRLDPHQHPPSQRLALDRQTATLVIGETGPLALEMLTKNPILLLKVLQDILLLPM